MLDELTVPLRGPSRNGACGFPLTHAGAHELADSDFVWLDVSTRTHLGKNLGGRGHRLRLRSAQGHKLGNTSACNRIAPGIKFQTPAKFSAPREVAFHLFSPFRP